MTTPPKWTRPEHPATQHTTLRHNGRNWTAWQLARQAIADAEHAGDPLMAAAILRDAAARIAATSELWTRQRPPLGVRRTRREAA